MKILKIAFDKEFRWFSIFTIAFYAIAFASLFSFDNTDCRHVFVATEPATVEYTCRLVPHPMMPNAYSYVPPVVGSHGQDHDSHNKAEGISLVCVKCFLEKKQVIHYKHEE
jgi:hypothetical protein